MDGSILEDVRVACGLGRDDDSFDDELILHTNSILFRSVQLGVGKKGFSIDSVDQQWTDFVPENFEYYEALKSFIGLRVKILFDPPETQSVLAAINDFIKELEWTIYAEAEVNKED